MAKRTGSIGMGNEDGDGTIIAGAGAVLQVVRILRIFRILRMLRLLKRARSLKVILL